MLPSAEDDAEKIRLKRLAKLGGAVASTSGTPVTNPAPAWNSRNSSSPVTAAATATPPPAKVATAPTSTQPSAGAATTAATATTFSSQSSLSSRPSITPDQWHNDALQRVLQVTVNQEDAHRFVHLAQLAQELQQEQLLTPLQLSSSVQLDRILVARLQLPENADEAVGYHKLESGHADTSHLPLEKALVSYLLHCWKRAEELKRGQNAQRFPERIQTMQQVQDLCVSYAGLLLQFPDMFPQPRAVQDLGSAILLPMFLVDTDLADSVPDSFLEALIARFDGDGLAEIAGPWINGLSAEMRTLSLRQNYMPVLRAMANLLRHKALAVLIVTLPSFNPEGLTARAMEVATVLGPFFRLTSFGLDDNELARSYFGDASQRTRANVDSAWTSLRLALVTIQQALYQIVMTIIKSSPEGKEAMLEWFATVLRKNEGRAKMHIADRNAISTDGFMANILAVLLKLCDPIMDYGYTKLHLINPEYLKTSKRIDISKLTKMNATADEEKEYFGDGSAMDVDPTPPNFVTEMFFLTMSFQHYGIHRTILTYLDILRELKDAQRTLEKMKEQKQQQAGSPRAAMNEQMLQRVQHHVDKLISYKLSFDVQLLDAKFLSHVMQFHNLAMRLFLRIATSPSAGKSLNDPEYGKGAQFKLTTVLPLPEGPPICFRMFPEYFVEDIAELVLQVTRFQPEALVNVGGSLSMYLEELVTFAVVFLRSGSGANTSMLSNYTESSEEGGSTAEEKHQSRNAFIRNPYLISKWVEVLFSLTWDYGRGSVVDTATKNVFGTLPVAQQYLVSGLIAFYADVEKTGLSSQFYDKFSIRYNISQILKLLWNTYPDVYRPKVNEESVVRSETFIKFVNLLMNDTTYLLDEGLSNLAKVHSLQVDMEASNWSSLPQTEQEDKQKKLDEAERKAKSCIQLANETVHMLQYLTTAIVAPFIRPEIIDRLAAMLNFNLVQLVGPKCTDLKVKNPEEFGFRPKELLSNIIDIYVNLSKDPKHPEFVTAVARDGRSYHRQYFDKAASILYSKGVKADADIQKLVRFVERVEAVVKQDQREEEEMGEVPEEFLDPLMFTLMEDPVILPTSRTTIDRSTITSHLLSDSTDPFNRAPLKLEQVKPDVELKAKIEAWKASKKKQ